jgi:hypothetical protein
VAHSHAHWWQEDLGFHHMAVCIGLLKCPQIMAASFPQRSWSKRGLSLDVTHCHFSSVLLVAQVSLFCVRKQ